MNFIKNFTKISSFLELKIFIITCPGYLIKPFHSVVKKIVLLLTKYLEGRTGTYIDYKFYPRDTKYFNRSLLEKKTKYKIGIIIQGPIIKKNNLTQNVIKQFQKITCLKNKVLLSTWEEDLSQKKDQKIFNEITDVIIKNKKPEFCGPNNVNLQIISTANGIKYFDQKKFDYILKVRTDQIYYSENILNFLENLVDYFPKNKDKLIRVKIRNKIITCQPKSKEIFSINDQLMFASVNDLKNYWNLDSIFLKKNFLNKNHIDTKIFQKYGIKSYLNIKFLKRINYKFIYNKISYLNSLNDIFCLVDLSFLNRYWSKYPFERHLETISSRHGYNSEQLYFFDILKRK